MKFSDRPIDPLQIDLGKRDQDFVLYHGDQPLKTLSGHDYKGTDRLLRMILLEILEHQYVPLKLVSLSMFYEIQKDFVEHGRDLVQKNLETLMDSDPFIAMKTSGKGLEHLLDGGSGDQGDSLQEGPMISRFWAASSLLNPLNEQVNRMLGRFEVQDTGTDPILYLVRSAYAERTQAEKAVLNVLCFVHNAGITLPLLWVMGTINSSEYSRGLLAIRSKGLLSKMRDIAIVADTPFSNSSSRQAEQQDERLDDFRRDLSLASDYLAAMRENDLGAHDLEALIRVGESATLEFKSTLRWDLRANKTNPAIERACLKTLAAFLNSDGGILLIGIRDDGSVEGIGSDRLPNDDKFLLHLWTLIRTCFGHEVSPYIRTDLKKLDDKPVCIVTCNRCDYPVFLHQPGFPEEFYIRSGPASNALSVSEALKYIGDRFSPTS